MGYLMKKDTKNKNKISCEIEIFLETHFCKLCVILLSNSGVLPKYGM